MSLIATLFLTIDNKIFVYQGTHGKYFNIENGNENNEISKLFPIYYDIHFPIDWILKDCFSGPVHCENCKEYGFYNGVFIGYCKKCADLFKCPSRGNGFLIYPETKQEDMLLENNIWNTYLKGVTVQEIGDTKLADDRELYKDLPSLLSYSSSDDDSSNKDVFANFDYYKKPDLDDNSSIEEE